MQASLLPQEWIAVASSFVILLTITALGLLAPTVREIDVSPQLGLKHEFLIQVKGEVQRPGFYIAPKGVALDILIEQALPNQGVNRSAYEKIIIKKAQSFTIAARPFIKIWIDGAAKRCGPHLVPKGTRLCDLSQHLDLGDAYQPSSLKAKRRLRQGETVYLHP